MFFKTAYIYTRDDCPCRKHEFCLATCAWLVCMLMQLLLLWLWC